MNKIQVDILGLSTSQASNGAYALILQENEGMRRLPIVIGAFEAQAIALEMEGVKPPRPMTHDLLKTVIEALGATLVEVVINDLQDGTFYAQLILDSTGVEIDSRPSDAIALAVRFNVPIFVTQEVFDEAGFLPENAESEAETEEEAEFESEDISISEVKDEPNEDRRPSSRIDILQAELEKAIKKEDYETAAVLRDEINKLAPKA